MKIEKEKLTLFIKVFTFFIFFTPLIKLDRFFFPFVGPKSLYFMGLVEIIFFLWVLLIFTDRKYRPKFNFVLFFVLVYLFSFFLSTIFGVDPGYSFWSKHERMTGLLMQLHLFAFFLVLSSTFKEEDFKIFFAFSVFVSILVGFIAISNIKEESMRGGGTLGNESFLGTYLLFNVFFALYLFFRAKSGIKIFSAVSFFILIFFLLHCGVKLEKQSFASFLLDFFYKSGARAAKISFYGALILIFFIWLANSKNKALKFIGLPSLILGVSVVIFALYSVMFSPESFFRKKIEQEIGSFGGRFYVWQTSMEAFREKPIFGFGPENFEFAFLKHYNPCFGRGDCGGDVWYDRAHNAIFDTLVSQGLVGLISYFLLIFGTVFLLWKKFLKKEFDFWTSSVFTALFAAYFVQNLTVFDMVSSYLMLFFTLSFISSLERKEIEGKVEKPREVGPFTLALLFILFLLPFYFFIISPVSSSRAVIEFLSSKTYDQAKNKLQQAFSSPLGRKQIREFLGREILNNVKSVLNKNTQVNLDFLNLVQEELEKNIKENSLDYRSYLTLGEILGMKGAILKDSKLLNEAENVLKRAIEVSPKNQQAYLLLGQNYLFEGKKEEAISLFQKALDLDKEHKIYHIQLIRLLKILGEEELVKKKVDEALKINPEWKAELENMLKNIEATKTQNQ
jgi:O-antigen ligase